MAALGLLGLRLGALPIGDNSAFVHLATGRLIAAGGGIPRTDPYSFTAVGVDWVVQSWLPSMAYGWLWRLYGPELVVVFQAVLMAAAATLVSVLARSSSPLRSAGAAVVAVGIGAPYWAPRPLMFGVICLALTILVVSWRRSPWWLVPIAWIWVNSHGSFPLAVVWLVATGVGGVADARSWRGGLSHLRYLAVFVGAMGAASVNPLGWRILAFPFSLGEKRQVFQTVTEWRPPNFQSHPGLVSLVFLILALVIMLAGRRRRWIDTLPFLGFLGMSLLAARNLPMFAVVAAPALGWSFAGPATDVPGSGSSAGGDGIRWAASVVMAAVGVLTLAAVWQQPAIRTKGYPVAAVDRLERQGLLGKVRIAHQDVPGGYLILRQGGDANVFIDDRVDMYPVSVSDDYSELLNGRRRALDVLDRWEIDVVLWQQDRSLVSILQASDRWHRTFSSDGWVIYQRR